MSEFDYVIVGAGSAGCVLAARLTEDPDVKVCLLEAGPPDVKENVHVPLGYLSLAKTDVDWDYSTAPEPFCGGRRVYLPRGKVASGRTRGSDRYARLRPSCPLTSGSPGGKMDSFKEGTSSGAGGRRRLTTAGVRRPSASRPRGSCSRPATRG